ncbi:prominin-1-A-like [Arapaima gigas]
MVHKAGLVLLLCWGFTCSEPQAIMKRSASETLDLGYVPTGVYETLAYYEPGAIGILFRMAQSFLHVVQPNPFPRELITKIIRENFRASEPDLQKALTLCSQALHYEIGFVVCTVLGALFVLLMPLVGLCFCMCRCCENCGGEMHQRQRKNDNCKRTFLASGLFTTSVFIMVGVLCAYSANQNLTSQLKGVRRLVNSNMRDLQTFANQTPLQIDYLASQYFTVKNRVFSDLDNIGLLLGGKIQEQLGKKALPALGRALTMTSAIRDTKQALENVSSSVELLKEGSSKLQDSLNQERSSLENTLLDPTCSMQQAAPVCNSISNSLNQLNINADFSKLPNVSMQLAKVNDVLKTDLGSIVQRGYLSFNHTPALVEEQTKDVVKGLESHLDDIGTKVTSITKKVPLQKVLANFTVFISQIHSIIEDLYPEIDQIDFYRWVFCIALCCTVVLILAFNSLGLLCGICGHDKHASPTTRGCISNTGGNLLMAGVGFTFIFSWVLMAVVATTFVVGGNVEKLVCEPFWTKELFKARLILLFLTQLYNFTTRSAVVDTPYLVNTAWQYFIPGFLYNKPDINLTAESLYRYGRYHSTSGFTLLYMKDISENFENLKVDLTTEVLLEDEGKQNLINFSQTGIEDIKFQLMSDICLYLLQPQGTLESALRQHVRNLQQIYNQQVVPLEQDMVRGQLPFSTTLRGTQLLQVTSKVRVLPEIYIHCCGVQHHSSFVILQESQKYMKNIIGYFERYVDWVTNSLALDVAGCKPLSNFVDTAEIVACSFVVDSVNAFWFGLGWATIFLIPSVIFSVRLAKFYRRMDTEDVYDDFPPRDLKSSSPQASAPPREADW